MQMLRMARPRRQKFFSRWSATWPAGRRLNPGDSSTRHHRRSSFLTGLAKSPQMIADGLMVRTHRECRAASARSSHGSANFAKLTGLLAAARTAS